MKRVFLCMLGLIACLAAGSPRLTPEEATAGDGANVYAPLHDKDSPLDPHGAPEEPPGPPPKEVDPGYIPNHRYMPPDTPATPQYGEDSPAVPYMTPVWDRYAPFMPAPELEPGRAAFIRQFEGVGEIPQVEM